MTEVSKNLVVGFLYDDTLDSNDGVAHQVKTIGSWLSAQGHRVVYLVGETKMTSWDGGKVYSISKNHKVTFNGNKLSIPWPASASKISEILKAENIDVLHVQVPYSPFMSMKVINRASSSTAIIGTFHIFPSGVLTKWGAKLLRIFYGRSLRRFDEIISVSPAAQNFADWAFKIRSVVLPNAVNTNQLKSKSPVVRPQTQTVVFLGRLVDRKGVLCLLKAFLQLHSELPNVRLKIAGDGPKRLMLEKFVRNNELTNVVSFSGFISESGKAELLAGADLACFPSLYGESFGIVLVEAMAAGADVVLGGDNPGYKTVLGEQPKMLIDPKNTDEFAKRLKQLLTDQDLRENLHNWQQNQIKKYDIRFVGPKILQIYTHAIANKTINRHN